MISFVYFDVGGVVEMDFSGTNKWSLLKQELGITPKQDREFDIFWQQYESECCLGRDAQTVIPLMEKKFGTKLPSSYSFLIDGFVNRFTVNKSIWPVINEIHRKCRVGLLTNMYPGMLEAIRRRSLLPDVIWDVVIDSSIEGVQKPDPKIFKLSEKRAGVKGQEILFTDNSPGHIKAASDFGWQTFLYDSAHPGDSSRNLSSFFNQLNDISN